MSVASVVCCQVEVSASGRSLVQRSPTECGVSEYDRKASIMGGSGPLGAVVPLENLFSDTAAACMAIALALV